MPRTAEYVDVTKHCLYRLKRAQGPRHFELEGQLWYGIEDLDEFLARL